MHDVKEKGLSGDRCVGNRPALYWSPHIICSQKITATHNSVFKKTNTCASNASSPTTSPLQNAAGVTGI